MVKKIPIGPFHPILEEPEFFELHVDGERVVGIDMTIGWSHRGIELLSEHKTWDQVPFLVERICGICSCSHPYAYVKAVEDLCGIEIAAPRAVHPLHRRRARAAPQPPPLDGARRALPRLQHGLHVDVAVPRADPRRPRGGHRQPQPLRGHEAGGRAPRPPAGGDSEHPQAPRRARERTTICSRRRFSTTR